MLTRQCSRWADSLQFLTKLNTLSPHNKAITHLGIYPTESVFTQTYVHKEKEALTWIHKTIWFMTDRTGSKEFGDKTKWASSQERASERR